MKKFSSTSEGFTLVELLVVVGIVAILVVIAYPSFERFIVKSNRGDAHSALQAVELAQERYRTRQGVYGTLDQIGAPAISPEGLYAIGVTDPGRTSYTVTATAVNPQLSREQRLFGAQCVTISLQADFAKVRRLPAECW